MGSGGPSWGSETVFGTDVRNRQCSEQCSEPTKCVEGAPSEGPLKGAPLVGLEMILEVPEVGPEAPADGAYSPFNLG